MYSRSSNVTQVATHIVPWLFGSSFARRWYAPVLVHGELQLIWRLEDRQSPSLRSAKVRAQLRDSNSKSGRAKGPPSFTHLAEPLLSSIKRLRVQGAREGQNSLK